MTGVKVGGPQSSMHCKEGEGSTYLGMIKKNTATLLNGQ
ncbi:hypothetical protein OURE66S_03085 [Oligella ureolytica]